MKTTYEWVLEGVRVLFVRLEERVHRVDDVGGPRHDEHDEDDEQRHHDALLLHENDVLGRRAVQGHAAAVRTNRAEDPAVTERHDEERHDVAGRHYQAVVDVGTRVVRVHRSALRRVWLITDVVQPVDCQVPD